MKDILVYVDTGARAALRVDLAIRLAQRFGAHLTGLHVIPPPFVPMMTHTPIPPEIVEEQVSLFRDLAAKAEATFRTEIGRAGVPGEWRTTNGFPAELVPVHARYAALTVLGQSDPDEPGNTPLDLPDRVALGAGGPVLVVPRAGSFADTGQRVVVAWSATREAKRAIDDAMPILAQAKQVTVLAIKPKTGPTRHGDVPGADIALYLARHGVKAEAAQVYGEDMSVPDLLLSRAADLGADLIVMGAYGHARLLELALGGTTRAILARMTVPVLMSH